MRRAFTNTALRACVVVAVALTSLGLLTSPANAALSNVSLVASNNQVSASGVTMTFVAQAGAADAAFAVILPAGVTGLNVNDVTVSTSPDGSTWSAATLAAVNPLLVSAAGDRLAVNLLSALSAGQYVKIVVSALTNPGSAADYTMQIGGSLLALTQANLDAALATLQALLAEISSITFTVVNVVTNTVSQLVGVAPALTFTVGSASHSWSLDPSGTASSNNVTDTLSVATNAASYVLQAYVGGNLVREGTDGSSPSDYIAYNASASGPHFGYEVTGPSGDAVNSATFHTFSTSPADVVNGWSLSGLTNGEDTTITYDVGIDYTKSPGTYVGDVTYRIVPTY